MVTMRNGDCRITHREYIQDIVAGASGPPTTLSITTLSVNPGLQATFPWLSKVAQNFESYRFRKLKFCYETEAPSSLGGTLVIALDYDSADAPPSTKQQALAYRGSVRSAPWTACCHSSVFEDLNKQKSYFVRSGALLAGQDILLRDNAKVYLLTQGVTTSAAACGELYVEYDIDLLTPLYEPIFSSGSLANNTATGQSTTNLVGTVTSSTGNMSVTNLLNVLTITNLSVGQDVSVAVALLGGSITGTLAAGATSGCTAVNSGSPTVAAQAADAGLFTFVATATVATVTLSGISNYTGPAGSMVIVSNNVSNLNLV